MAEGESQSQDGKVLKAFQNPLEPFKFFPRLILELELSDFSSCLR